MTFTRHVLLVGCDQYPPGVASLSGCVNDIDAVQGLLVGQDDAVVRMTGPSATKTSVVAALQELSSASVKAEDRVLIYYSGHGTRARWDTARGYHEALALSDGERVELLYDVELSALLQAICHRTTDVTVILDCCHSGGATRDLLPPLGRQRFLGNAGQLARPPDLDLLRTASSIEPNYLAVAACSAVESAAEGALDDERPLGVLTYALTTMLRDTPPERRPELRWSDIWSDLRARMAQRSASLRRRAQHPRLIGATDRRVLGGAWQRPPRGLAIHRDSDGSYTIDGGQFMGIREGATIAVYASGQALLEPLGSPDEVAARQGILRVVSSQRSSASVIVDQGPLDIGMGALGRVIHAPLTDRLRVAIAATDPVALDAVRGSGLLESVCTPDADVDATVVPRSEGGWTIGNDLRPDVAVVPFDHSRALRAGLEHVLKSVTVLRMTQPNVTDIQLSGRLDVSVLDCRDPSSDPPEAPCDDDGIYRVPAGFVFAISVASGYPLPLQVCVLNCASGGAVEFLGDVSLSSGDRQVVWLQGVYGRPFVAQPDDPSGGVDRLVAIATTDLDADLSYLSANRSVQEVVDQVSRGATLRSVSTLASPPRSLWTGTLCPLRILPRASGAV
jgi:hypothetical protein